MNARLRCRDRAPGALLVAALASSMAAVAAEAPAGSDAAFEYVVQAGHTAEIHGLAYAPDGRFFATGSKDSTLKLWSPNGTLIRTIATGYWVDEMAITADSRSILAASRTGTIRLLSLAGKVLRAYPRVPYELGLVEAVAVSPDGRYAAIGTTSRRILIYDLADSAKGAVPVVLEVPAEKSWGVQALVFTPDGKLISGHGDGRVRIWNAQRQVERTLQALDYGVFALALSPDGKTLATAGRPINKGAEADTRLLTRLWDMEGRPIGEFASHSTESLHFTPDGTTLVSGGCYDGEVRFYTRAGELVRTFTVGKETHRTPQRIAISPDARSVITADDNINPPGLRMWTADGHFERNLQSFSGAMTNVAASPDGSLIATLSGDGWLRVWSPTGRLLGSVKADDSYSTELAWAPNGEYFASGGSSVVLWDREGRKLGTVEGVPDNAGALAFTPDSRFLLCGDGKGFVHIYDLVEGKARHFEAHDSRVSALAADPTGKFFATGSARNHVRIWDMAGNLQGEYQHAEGLASPAYAIDFFPDGQHLIAATTDAERTLLILDLKGQLVDSIRTPNRHMGGDVAISAGGHLIAATVNNQIAVWNGHTHELVRVLSGHIGSIAALSFLGAGTHLVSAGHDSTTRVWRLQDRYSMTLLARGTEWLMYSPDGYFDGSRYGGELVAMTRGLDVFSVDQFAVRTNRPDLILSHLGLGREEYIDHLRALYRRRLERSGLQEEATFELDAPEVHITSAVQDGKYAHIEAQLTSRSRPLQSYQVYVNDVPLFPGRGKPLTGKDARVSERVELVHGDNLVEIGAFDDRGAEALRARWSAVYRAPVESDLYFIGVGVSHYRDPGLDLQFAHKDVLDLAAVLHRYEGAFHRVIVKTYVDEAVTVDNIRKAKEVLREADTDDTVVVLVSGHGAYDASQEATWYYGTWNVDVHDLAGTGASFDQLESLLRDIAPRRKLMLIDACDSGEMDDAARADIAARAREAGLDPRTSPAMEEAHGGEPRRVFLYDRGRYIYNDLSRRTGAIIFSASHAGEMSFESSSIENGFFTQQIIDALGTPEADTDYDGMISVGELQAWVTVHVGLQTAGLQRPTIDRDNISQRVAFPLLR
ncbi:MAG TPA: caspase family protein [Woeseiaceae bacterium]